MGLNDDMEKMKFDTRLIEWNLKHKHLKRDDLQKHLGSLPDSGGNVERLSFASEAMNGGGGNSGNQQNYHS